MFFRTVLAVVPENQSIRRRSRQDGRLVPTLKDLQGFPKFAKSVPDFKGTKGLNDLRFLTKWCHIKLFHT